MAEYVDKALIISRATTVKVMGEYITVVPIEAIDKFPAADVVPVRHGKWVRGDISYRYPSGMCACSECGEIDPFSTGKMNYCPNCGADMGGG